MKSLFYWDRHHLQVLVYTIISHQLSQIRDNTIVNYCIFAWRLLLWVQSKPLRCSRQDQMECLPTKFEGKGVARFECGEKSQPLWREAWCNLCLNRDCATKSHAKKWTKQSLGEFIYCVLLRPCIPSQLLRVAAIAWCWFCRFTRNVAAPAAFLITARCGSKGVETFSYYMVVKLKHSEVGLCDMVIYHMPTEKNVYCFTFCPLYFFGVSIHSGC